MKTFLFQKQTSNNDEVSWEVRACFAESSHKARLIAQCDNSWELVSSGEVVSMKSSMTKWKTVDPGSIVVEGYRENQLVRTTIPIDDLSDRTVLSAGTIMVVVGKSSNSRYPISIAKATNSNWRVAVAPGEIEPII